MLLQSVANQSFFKTQTYNKFSQINVFLISVMIVQKKLTQTLQIKAVSGAKVCGDGSNKLEAALFDFQAVNISFS